MTTPRKAQAQTARSIGFTQRKNKPPGTGLLCVWMEVQEVEVWDFYPHWLSHDSAPLTPTPSRAHAHLSILQGETP